MKKYIFDFDGTLVDSMPVWADFILDHLRKLDIEYPPDIIKIVSPLGTRGAAEYLISLGVDGTADELVQLMDDFAMNEYEHNIPAKPYVIEKLTELKEKGHSLNIFTACRHNLLDVCLKRLGIFNMFDHIISCEEDMGINKKSVDAYVKIATKLGTVCEDCVFFDDNIGALEASHRAGMITVGVYDDSSSEWEQDIRDIVDKYIYDFSEI